MLRKSNVSRRNLRRRTYPFAVSMSTGYALDHLVIRGGVIEFVGPPGVGKSFLIKALKKDARRIRMPVGKSIDLELCLFREYLWQAKIADVPTRAKKERYRLRRDLLFCDPTRQQAFLLDEHLAQHHPEGMMSLLNQPIDGADDFFLRRLVVVMEDTPERIVDKIVQRHESGQRDFDFDKFSPEGLAAYLEQEMVSKRNPHHTLRGRGFHSVLLDASESVETNVARVLDYRP